MHRVRAILDPGSQSSLITDSLYKKLQLEGSEICTSLEAVNNVSCQIKYKCKVNITAHHYDYSLAITCLVIQEITGLLPSTKIRTENLQIPSNITLADPAFYLPTRVDILLGADCFWNLLCVGQIKVGKEHLIMQKTRLGWIAAGPFGNPSINKVHCNFSKCVDINNQLIRFWELEEGCNQRQLSKEERACETHFMQTHKRDDNGRFVVNIPLKQDPSSLGESFHIAKKRLINLESKLHKDSTVRERYTAFLQEYKALGHMTQINDSQLEEAACYLPHHCVLRSESLTTKIRVVFDASAATENGTSLNDIQMIGPTLQDDLFEILIRFRMHTYVISADIEKMFRQILVAPEQRFLQRILWRSNAQESIQTFQLRSHMALRRRHSWQLDV